MNSGKVYETLFAQMTDCMSLVQTGNRNPRYFSQILQAVISDDEITIGPKRKEVVFELTEEHFRSEFGAGMRAHGWQTISGNFLTPGIYSFTLEKFLGKGEKQVSGETLEHRALLKGALLGEREAEYFVKPYSQQFIPVSWRQWLLVFPGTRWTHLQPGEQERIPFLAYEDGAGWSVMHVCPTRPEGFDREFRLVRATPAT